MEEKLKKISEIAFMLRSLNSGLQIAESLLVASVINGNAETKETLVLTENYTKKK